MREPDNMLAVANLLPDYMGFIFYKESPRYVGPGFYIPDSFPSTVKKVGVFVNEESDVVLELVDKHKLDVVQLHGDESTEYCSVIKRKNIELIKVFRIDEKFDFAKTSAFNKVADFFLFDTKGNYFGGNAQTFNWQLLSKYMGPTPFLLSGGLNVENIARVKSITQKRLAGIDLNSGVEFEPGRKDLKKIEQLLTELNA